MARAIEAAFDYRGDVTLTLAAGEVVGYLSNRNASAREPYVEVFPADGSPLRRILYREIQGVAFTGRRRWSVRLRTGTYRYRCDPHRTTMRGRLTVV